jgi:hypothetical protein
LIFGYFWAVGILKFLFITFFVLWLLGILGRLLLPFALRYLVKRLTNMSGMVPPQHRQKHPEGSVHIKGNPPTETRYRPDDGEYVDYEEIK